jgi:hypothetical protein
MEAIRNWRMGERRDCDERRAARERVPVRPDEGFR